MTADQSPDAIEVRLDHMEEINRHRDRQCANHNKTITETRSRLDRLVGWLWILWPILLLLVANAAAIVVSTQFR